MENLDLGRLAAACSLRADEMRSAAAGLTNAQCIATLLGIAETYDCQAAAFKIRQAGVGRWDITH
jgi:hypothetical protein